MRPAASAPVPPALATPAITRPASDPGRVELTEALVRRHQREVWRHLRFLGASPQTADDLTQETFLRLLRTAVDDRGEAALAAWLRATARHLFLAQGRRRAGLELSTEVELEAAWAQWAADDGGEAAHAALERCLARLDGRARRALVLRYAEGQTRTALAKALDLSVEGTKTLLRRSKQVLAACVREARTR